jgi:AraC family transcriptional regulator
MDEPCGWNVRKFSVTAGLALSKSCSYRPARPPLAGRSARRYKPAFRGSYMSLVASTLHASPLVQVRDVVCSEACGHGRREERSVAASVALVRRGTFVRRDRLGRHVADATRVVLFDPVDPYVVDHPVPGGDRCTTLTFDPATLRESARPRRGQPDRVFTQATVASGAGVKLAHRELLAGARDGDALRVEEAALRVLQLCCAAPQPKRAGKPAHARRNAELAAEAQILIAARYTERLTLADLGAALDVSPYALCRAFRAATGTSLHRHLTELRLSVAIEEIDGWADRLTSLALDLGFSSHSHFTQAFREFYGRPPSALL